MTLKKKYLFSHTFINTKGKYCSATKALQSCIRKLLIQMQKISNGYLVVKGIINTQSLRLLGKYMRRGRRGLGITMFKFQISNCLVYNAEKAKKERERNIVCLRQISLILCPSLTGPMNQMLITINKGLTLKLYNL